jgi:tRNA(fMet)-specific endonuclease VapC
MPILDSDLLIIYLRKVKETAPDELILKKKKAIQVINELLDELADNEYLMTTIFNVGELYAGAYRSSNRLKEIHILDEFFKQFQILPFTMDDSYKFGEIKAQLLDDGQICGDMDILIASIAINHEKIIFTHNIDHFKSIKNLNCKDWMKT